MKTATVTYTAPPGESKTLDIAGATLVSGKSETVTCDDALMARMQKAGGMLKVENVTDAKPEGSHAPPEHDPKHKGKGA